MFYMSIASLNIKSNQSKNEILKSNKKSKELEPDLTPILSASNRKGKASSSTKIESMPNLSPIPMKPSPSKPPVSKVTNSKPNPSSKVAKKKKPAITTKISINTKK